MTDFSFSPGNPATEAGLVLPPPPKVIQTTLENGLTVLIQEDHSAPVASIQFWCRTGSIDEGRHLGAGLSHILEHLLFKGTDTRSNSQIAQTIQNQGGYINAYTSFDRTVYWVNTPSKGVQDAIEILSDAMMNSTLPEEEYAKEQEVIRREFAMGFDDPDRMISQKLFATAYREHPCRLPVIGHLDIYNQLTRDDVMEYYKARYIPNNLFLVVAGDVNPGAIISQVENFFTKYPQKSLPPRSIPDEPPQFGLRESHIEFPAELTRLELAWHTPQLTHPDVPALDVLASILGDGRSSIFNQTLRERKKLVHGISAGNYSPLHTGMFTISAVLDANRREEVIHSIRETIEELKAKGVQAKEVEKAKKMYLASHVQSLTTMQGKASDLASSWFHTGGIHFSTHYLDAIQRVVPADVHRVLNHYFTDPNLTLVSLNPPGSLAGESKSLEKVEAGEIKRFTLSNGLRLLVREDHRLPSVSMVATFKAGSLVETPEQCGLSRLVAKTLIKGTATRSAVELAEALEEVGGGIGCDAGNNSIAVSVRVLKPDLKLGIELLSDVLLHPAFQTDEVQREKDAQLAGIKAEQEEVTIVARNLMRRNLYPGHPYGYPSSGTPETVSGLGPDDLREFHKRFVVGNNGVLAVFGDVNAGEVRNWVEQALGAMPSGQEALQNPPMPSALEGNRTVEELNQKAQAILMVGFRGVSVFDPDATVLDLIDEACSDLGSRFFIRIREKMGLAYFVGTSQMMGLAPGPFVFYLGTSPEKVDAVRAELLDEIHQLALEGLTPEELSRAKEKRMGQQEIQNQGNDAFAHLCALDELYGLGFDHYQKLRNDVESVTVEETKRVANKYFLNQPSVIAVVRPGSGTKGEVSE